MKKILTAILMFSLFCGCSLFRGSEKTGCPSNGRNVGAERVLAGDKAALKASKAKYKGGRKSY